MLLFSPFAVVAILSLGAEGAPRYGRSTVGDHDNDFRFLGKDHCDSCFDEIGFFDAKGAACVEWVGYTCDTATGGMYEYTAEEMAAIALSCPKSCGLCTQGNSTYLSRKLTDDSTSPVSLKTAINGPYFFVKYLPFSRPRAVAFLLLLPLPSPPSFFYPLSHTHFLSLSLPALSSHSSSPPQDSPFR